MVTPGYSSIAARKTSPVGWNAWLRIHDFDWLGN